MAVQSALPFARMLGNDGVTLMVDEAVRLGDRGTALHRRTLGQRDRQRIEDITR
jgi:hypothetical protein